MAEFLTTHSTAAEIENIILNSNQKLVLVSPYLQLSRTFFTRLKDADERGVKSVIVYGKNQLRPDERSQLARLKNLSQFFCENLHAKCYFNEDNMVITSMNIYEFSEKNNREMGVLIKRQDDADVFKAAVREVQSFVKSSVKEETKDREAARQLTTESVRKVKKPPSTITEKPSIKNVLMDALSTVFTDEKLEAFCIRCRDRLPFDRYHPLCDECYWVWSDYGNPNFHEHYCHSCGKQTETTKDKPLCRSCFAKWKY
jgi:hypothetical protein